MNLALDGEEKRENTRAGESGLESVLWPEVVGGYAAGVLRVVVGEIRTLLKLDARLEAVDSTIDFMNMAPTSKAFQWKTR